MALLFMEGFGSNETTHKWDPSSSNFSSQSSTPRVSGGYYGQGSVEVLYKTITASAQVFVGFGMRNSGLNSPYISFYGDAGATRHITVVRNSSTAVLEIRRGTESGTLLASGSQPLLNDQWNYIEVSVTISDTVGEVHVRLNGITADEVSYTGDTKNAGTSTNIDRVQFYTGTGAVNDTDYADVYILNSTGSAPTNTFLGDVVVRTLNPSGNGTYSQLTGSDGNQVDNYLLADERPFSSTDYVGSVTVGNKDTYAIADLPGGVTTIYGVQLNGMMAKSDGSAASARYLLRSGGTDYPGVTRGLTTTYTGYYEMYTTDPATSVAWTTGGVNGIETGMEVM